MEFVRTKKKNSKSTDSKNQIFITKLISKKAMTGHSEKEGRAEAGFCLLFYGIKSKLLFHNH